MQRMMKENRSSSLHRHRCSALLLMIVWWLALLDEEVDAFASPATFSSCKLNKPPIISASTKKCLVTICRHSVIKSLAASTENNEDNDISNEFKVNHGKQEVGTDDAADAQQHQTSSPFLSLGYSLAAVMNVAAAMSLLWGSCASKSSISSSDAASASASIQLLSNNYHYWDPTFTSSILSYLLLGAGTCQLLSNITKHSPQNATHEQQHQQQLLQLRQRLTIGTFLFSTIGLFSIPGEASYHYQQQLHHQVKFATSLVLCQLSKLITAVISFIGWEGTIPGGFGSSSITLRGKNILCEITNGIKSTWKTMPISNTHPVSFYRTFFIFVTLGNVVLNLPNLIFYLKEGVNWCSVPVSLIVSSIGRGSLLSMILFVLKEEYASRSISGHDVDLNDGRKVKGPGTFIVLNVLVGLWAWGGECEVVCYYNCNNRMCAVFRITGAQSKLHLHTL